MKETLKLLSVVILSLSMAWSSAYGVTSTKELIVEQELNKHVGETSTFNSASSCMCETQMLYKLGYEVDALMTHGGGVNYTKATIDAALTAIGTTKQATLLLRPGTWMINTDADYSAYTNVKLKLVPGALLKIATSKTLTVGDPFDAGLYQVFSCVGTGKVVFRSGSINEIYPEWYGLGGINDTTAFASAIASGSASRIPVKLQAKTYFATVGLYAWSQLLGSGMYGTAIVRPTGTTAPVIGMVSGQAATGVKVQDLKVNGGNIGANLDGINLGTETPGTTDYAWNSTLTNVQSYNNTGYGIRIHSNVGNVLNVWASTNKVGLYVTGSAFYGYNISTEVNADEDIDIAATDVNIFGIQTEGEGTADAAKDVVHVSGADVHLYGVYSNHAVARRAVVGTEATAIGFLATNVSAKGDGPTSLINDSAVSGFSIANPLPTTNRAMPIFTNAGTDSGTSSVFGILTAPLIDVKRSNGQLTRVSIETEETTISSAATTATSITIPANSWVMSITCRVTTVIPTAKHFTIKRTDGAVAFTGKIATAEGSTNVGVVNMPYWNAAASTLTITPNLTPKAATGKVRINVHYIKLIAPTS